METNNSGETLVKLEKASDDSITNENTLDRISLLPDSILLDILSFLPADYVIRTSILSKRWQFLWTLVPVIDFSDIHRLIGTSCCPVPIISHTLIQHQSPKLKELRLRAYYRRKFASNVDDWLRIATGKEVEVLDIDLFTSTLRFLDTDKDDDDGGPCCYKVPLNLLNNSFLVRLSLRKCELQYGELINWRSLKVLSFSSMALCNDLIRDILSGSPLLEFLELYECRHFDFLDIKSASLKELVVDTYGSFWEPPNVELKIVAPNIESLQISGHLSTRKLSISNSSSLVHVQLNFEYLIEDEVDKVEYVKNMKETLENLRDVKDLTVGSRCLEVLAASEIEIVPFLSSKLECLRVHTGLCREEQNGIARLLSLFGHGFVPLTLVMLVDDDCYTSSGVNPVNENDDIENYLTALRKYSAAALGRIKTVQFVNFTFRESEMELILCLLKNAGGLEKMIIQACQWKKLSLKKYYEFARVLLSTPRCSGNSVVLF